MQAEERKKRIAEITKGDIYSPDGKGKRLRYCGEVKTFIEYEIPIELLVFNVENGRIASMVKSFERERSSLDPERPNDAQQIAQFLFDSNEQANEKTKKSIADNGQLETGIITSDGVIVDGNRRASLMLAIRKDTAKYTPEQRARCNKFRCVVLPEDANEKEILRLETTYQMGADEKVGYNPIEKYLHARDMINKGFAPDDIAEYMGLGSTAKVTELLEVMKLIDEYLDNYEYTGIYTRLPRGFEDDMLKLYQAINRVKGGYSNTDLLRVFNAMYEAGFFVDEVGANKATKMEVFRVLGDALHVDLRNASKLLSAAKGVDNDSDANTGIFDILKKKSEDYFSE